MSIFKVDSLDATLKQLQGDTHVQPVLLTPCHAELGSVSHPISQNVILSMYFSS